MPPPAREFDDPAVAAFAVPRRAPHPVGGSTDPVRLARPPEDFPSTRAHVRATVGAGGPGAGAFDAAAAWARPSDAWRYREVATTHMVPENRPAELADLLLELA